MAQNLAFRFPGGAGVGPVDLEVEAGGRLLVLGPSGSGKTTLLQLLAGLRTPQQGRILIDGQPLRPGRPAAMGVAVVFQTLRLVSALSVEANCRLARRLAGHADDAARVRALLERLGIAAKASARPHALAQGEAQRAALARALAAEPRVLLADEPTSALDDGNAAATAALLDEAARAASAALVVVTHDRRLAQHFARALRLGPDGRPEAG